MSAMPDVPSDAPSDTALVIEWDRDHSSQGQDPEEVMVVVGKWEWKSMQKRKEAEWTVDGYEVHVIRGRDEQGLMLETSGGNVELVRLHLTSEQYHALREHGIVQFQAESRTFPFQVTVIRRE